jgi:hypothetical protein
MQRTLNFTNRKRIEQKDALFSITDTSSEVPEFNVVFNLDATQFPADSHLYVEAHHKETRQRFDFGTVSKIRPPTNRLLEELDLSGPILFRVIIVDESGKHGLLLASGENFRADGGDADDDNKSSILTVTTRPMGQLTWKVEFETGGLPELCLNNNIPNAIEKMRVDQTFQALILPPALRQVLIYYLWSDDQESEIYQHWMAFAMLFTDAKPDGEGANELLEWVDEVVEGFVTLFGMCDMLVNEMRGDAE